MKDDQYRSAQRYAAERALNDAAASRGEGYNPHPSTLPDRPFKRGDNQREYANVESQLKNSGENRSPVYNKKHDMFE